MGKISELEMAIADLRNATAAINDVADTLAEMFSGTAEEKPATPAEPVLTLEAVRAVLAEKSRKGYTAEIRELLQKYGADKLSAVDPRHYAVLMKDVEVLGNAP